MHSCHKDDIPTLEKKAAPKKPKQPVDMEDESDTIPVKVGEAVVVVEAEEEESKELERGQVRKVAPDTDSVLNSDAEQSQCSSTLTAAA